MVRDTSLIKVHQDRPFLPLSMHLGQVAVVILNWNGKHHLERFLPALIARTPQTVKIIVADGGSTDGSVELLHGSFPAVRVIELGRNLGFAGGYNAALAQVQEEVLVLLNSDVEVREDWLPPLIEHLHTDHRHSACQPKVLAYNDPGRFEHAGAAGGFMDKNAYPFCRGRIFHSFEQDHGQYDDTTPVVWATGTCLAIKKKYFDEAGGFDADLFAHMEEIDLCWRLQSMGYQIHCVPKATVHHVGGGTLPYQHPRKTFLNFRNSLIVLTKNAPGSIFFRIIKRLMLDGLAGVKFILDGHPKHTWQVARAHWAYFISLPSTLRKRREAKVDHELTWPPGILHRSIVQQYFLQGKRKYSDL